MLGYCEFRIRQNANFSRHCSVQIVTRAAFSRVSTVTTPVRRARPTRFFAIFCLSYNPYDHLQVQSPRRPPTHLSAVCGHRLPESPNRRIEYPGGGRLHRQRIASQLENNHRMRGCPLEYRHTSGTLEWRGKTVAPPPTVPYDVAPTTSNDEVGRAMSGRPGRISGHPSKVPIVEAVGLT